MKRHSFPILVILFAVLLPAVALAGAEIRITADPSWQYLPAISGNKVVWYDNRNTGNQSYWDIYLYDITTDIETRITTTPVFGPAWAPSISGNSVVWADNRAGNWDIYLYDISTATETQITTDPANQFSPAISGDKIVWEDDRNAPAGSSDIYLYDLATNIETQITANSYFQQKPSISGNRIAWEDNRNGNWDIYLYDMTTGVTTQITTDAHNQWHPVISGDIIAWEDDRNCNDPQCNTFSGNWDIYMYDLSIGAEAPVTTAPSNQSNLSISGNRIVWEDKRNASPFNYDIYMYDLAVGAETPIITESHDQVYPAISGDQIVWADNRSGNWDIFLYDFATYTITATASGSGSISPPGATTVAASGGQTYTITADPGYKINYVAVNGASVGAVQSYTFSNVQQNYTIKADFVPITYKITVTAGANGAISPSTYSGFKAGASQTYSITPSTGYHVADVLVDGGSVGAVTSYPFTNIQANHTITATFAPNPTYTITATAGANGSISPGTTSLLGGQSQKYTIAAASGYRIDKVLVDNVNKGAVTTYTFNTINANHTIDASFVPDTYTITATAGTGGSISPSGATTVAGGGSQTYAIAPASGYKIDYVAVNGASVGSPTSYTFTNVRMNYTILASFVPVTYTITVTQGAHGAISPGTYKGFKAGASQTYTLYPDAGYHVDGLTVDGNAVNPPVTSYPFTNIQANHTITATFAPNPTYTITATAGANGSISPGTTSLLGGQSQKYTITAASGYRIDKVLVDNVNKGAIGSYTFSGVTAGHTIDASFVPDTYTITATAGTGGSISPSGATTVAGGGSQTYAIAPASGYKIDYVAVNGASVGSPTSYTFTNVRMNYTIKASFVPVTYTITVTQGAHGAISPGSYSGFQPGANQTYTITPDAGYTISDVLVDGSSKGAITSYPFSNITDNHTITATFAANP